MNKKYYVTMTDKALSGWGSAKGRINKLIFECDSYDEACTVAENANNRSDMKYVNITSKKPYYSSARYYTQYKDKAEYPSWYEKGYFKSA